MRIADFQIYPSLLIKYQDLLDYRLVAEEPWNKDSEGNYKLTPEEMYVKIEAELIDSINRCPKTPSEAADKGTAFNEIVDCIHEGRKSAVEGLDIVSERGADNKPVAIRAAINGFDFIFDPGICRETAAFFKGSLTQFFCDAVMHTKFGDVRLYGYIDEWLGDKIYDIKTTSRYSLGKYEHGWQRHVYPWCVIEMGLTDRVTSFVYYVVEWAYQAQGAPISAKNVFVEEYDYNHRESGLKIRGMVESFIDWLTCRDNDGFITSRKVFGGENPEGYEGVPVDVKKLEEYLFPKTEIKFN